MNIVYPRPIKAELYQPEGGRLVPLRGPFPLAVARSAQNLRQKNATNTLTCSLGALSLKVAGGNVETATSYVAVHPEIGPDDPRVCFAPTHETTELHWTLEHPERVTELTFEIYCAGRDPGQAKLLWRKVLTWTAGQCPASSHTPFDGSVDPPDAPPTEPSAASAVVTRHEDALLPSGYLDVRRSPYQVVARITGTIPGARAKVARRWVYVDVRVASITLAWGNRLWHTTNLSGVATTRGWAGTREERALFQNLSQQTPAPTAGHVYEIALPSNLIAKKLDSSSTELAEAADQTDFNQYKDLWGDGPRIPLRAEVKVLLSDGQTAVLAPEALGGARVLWDWDDDQPDRWQSWRTGPDGQITRDFLREVMAVNRAHQPSSANCPVECGGKLGGPQAPVFPASAVAPQARCTVAPCATRTWAAVSTFGAGGDGNHSAVIFNPSRMAGDRYRVRAWVEVSDELDCVDALAGPGAITAEAGTFVVRRAVDVHYAAMPNTQLGVTQGALQAALQQEFLDGADLRIGFHAHALSLPTYAASLRGAIDERVADPAQVKNFEVGHFFFEHALDMAPAQHAAAINFRPRASFEQDVQAALRDHHILLVTLPPGVARERIRSGNKLGDVLWLTSLGEAVKAQGMAFLVMHATSAGDFASNEVVQGLQTNTSGPIQVHARPRCWGHSVTVRRDDSRRQALHDGVEVEVNGWLVDVPFGRKAGRLGTVLPQASANTLRQEVLRQASALGPGRALDMVVVARDSKSARKQERVKTVTAFLEAMFAGVEIIDQKVFWDERSAWTWGAYMFLSFRNTIPDQLSGPMVRRCAEALLAPTDTGVMVVHFEGGTNVAHRMEYFTRTWQEARSTGAFDGSVWPDQRQRGVVSFYTCDPALPTTDPKPVKDLDVVLVHEVGHALFLPHAARHTPTADLGGGEVPGVHVLHDNCLMNYELDSKHFCGLCLLRLRGWDWQGFRHRAHLDYEYKITLELDDPARLFLSPESAPRGRRERLDVLGLVNRPLDHPEAIAAGQFGWTHARKVSPGIDATGALDAAVKNFLVEGGALPAPGGSARMFIPTRTALFTRSKYFRLVLGADDNDLSDYEIDRFALGSSPADADAAYYEGNAALGRIPLRVKVVYRERGSNAPWNTADAAVGVTVFLQLVTPDALPSPPMPQPTPAAALGGTAYFAGPVGPALAQAPDSWMQEKILDDQRGPSSDPQSGNVHHTRGGTRGGVFEVFRKGRLDGFAPLPAGDIKHAQYVTTDANGEARVAFQPSRIAGDRFRLRAFVGPPTLPNSSGDRPGDDVVETGTLVRWRVARVSKHLFMPASGPNPPPWMADLANRTCTHDLSLQTNDRGVVCAACIDRFGTAATVDLKPVAMELARAHVLLVLEADAVNPQHLRTVKDDFIRYLKDVLQDVPDLGGPAQCGAVSITRNAMQADNALPSDPPNTKAFLWTNNGPLALPETLTIRPSGGGLGEALFACDGAAWKATANVVPGMTIDYAAGTGTVRVLAPDTHKGNLQVVGQFDAMHGFFDIDALLPDVFPDASPAIFNFALPPGYNAARRTGMPMEADTNTQGIAQPVLARTFIDAREDGAFAKGTMLLTLARCIDGSSGYMPGLCVVQGAVFDNYFLIWSSGTQEGKGAGNLVQLCKPNATTDPQHNALHEVCHTLLLQHAPSAPGYKPELHDANDTCAMSYDAHDGDLCGQCIAALRGVRTHDPFFVTQQRPPPQPINQPNTQTRRRFRIFG